MEPAEVYHYAALILRRLENRLTADETIELDAWLARSEANARLARELENGAGLEQELRFFASIDSEAAWEKVKTSREPEVVIARPRGKIWRYAAVFLLLCMAGGGAWYFGGSRIEQPLAAAKSSRKKSTSLEPGANKATLTLADGSVIELDGNHEVAAAAKGLRVSNRNGQLVYEVMATPAGKEVTYNTVATPRGGQYRVILPDGTGVWLNASSSLRFPTSFTGDDRTVSLTGEAYFEVTKDPKRPFKVQVANSRVQVYGTHFDVMAYADEEMKTTLLEGSVDVTRAGGEHVLLLPGQQAVNTTDGRIVKREVDAYEAAAWKDGMFVFNNEDVGQIMTRISRWYDAEIVYHANVADKHFTGKVSRYDDIDKLLGLMELTGGVHFSTEGKRITVTD